MRVVIADLDDKAGPATAARIGGSFVRADLAAAATPGDCSRSPTSWRRYLAWLPRPPRVSSRRGLDDAPRAMSCSSPPGGPMSWKERAARPGRRERAGPVPEGRPGWLAWSAREPRADARRASRTVQVGGPWGDCRALGPGSGQGARTAKKSWKFRLDVTAAVMPRSVDIAPCDHEGRDYHRVLPTRHQRRRALRPTGRRTPHQLWPPSPRHRAPAARQQEGGKLVPVPGRARSRGAAARLPEFPARPA